MIFYVVKIIVKTLYLHHPIPYSKNWHAAIRDKKYFNVLDMSQGFHQVSVAKEDRHKLAFTVDGVHWQYKRAPFGLSTIPGFFQAMVNSLLSGLVGKTCFVYLDDVLIMASTEKELLERTEEVLMRFVEFNLKLNPGKCKFYMKKVTYLGFKCDGFGITTEPSRIQKALNFPVPRTVKQLQAWLGLANYYKRFIEDYSKIVEPMLALTPHPNIEEQFELFTDASDYALRAVLEQNGKVIAYAAVEKEILAIVWSTDHWRHFLILKPFICYTDSKPLQGEVKKKSLSSRLMRFKLRLSEFNFVIKYRKGAENGNADALSRALFEDETNDENEKIEVYILIADDYNDGETSARDERPSIYVLVSEGEDEEEEVDEATKDVEAVGKDENGENA
ncbi:hypothetical protein HA402_006564 [Bradysia odoriphaga]|nr:hypothetical protein HA402_006564 [Bradysia odoriphaga]